MPRVEDAIPILIGPLAIVFFAVLVVALIYFTAQAKKKRREQIGAFAARHGFQLLPEEPGGCLTGGLFGGGQSGVGGRLIQMFDGFQPFGVGDSRRADVIVIGEAGPRTFYFFDYQYSTGSGKNRTTHHHGIAAVRVPMMFKGLSLRPEGVFDRIGAVFGFDDIQFESEEFNRQYSVRSADQKFAFDLVHPGMIDYLMRVRERDWQLQGPYMLACKQGYYGAVELEEVMADMEGFLDLIPEYVRQDLAFEARWASPLE